MEQNALEKFLSLPPPPKCVKLLRMVISNLVQNPDNPRFRSILVEKVRKKFERENVPWDLVIELFGSLGFTRIPNAEGRIVVQDFNLNMATSMLQLFEDFEQQQKMEKTREVDDSEVMRAMHTWDLPPEIESKLNIMISQARDLWRSRQDLVIEFFRPNSGNNLNNAIVKTALQTLVKNLVDQSKGNWDSQNSMFQAVPELSVEYILSESENQTGVQTLIESILDKELNVECFKKVMYVHAQRGDANIQRIVSSAAGRKVALVQLVDRLLELFTTYYEKLNQKIIEQSMDGDDTER